MSTVIVNQFADPKAQASKPPQAAALFDRKIQPDLICPAIDASIRMRTLRRKREWEARGDACMHIAN